MDIIDLDTVERICSEDAQMTLRKLQEEADSFRKALDQLPKDEPSWFKSFPEKTSYGISRILAQHLVESGFSDIVICSGDVLVDYSVDQGCSYYDEPNTFHAWLEVNGTIVDITADEFYAGPVIVRTDPTWHNNGFTERRERDKIGSLSLNADETALLQKVQGLMRTNAPKPMA